MMNKKYNSQLFLTATSYKLAASSGFTQHLAHERPTLMRRAFGFFPSPVQMPCAQGAGFTIVETLVAIAVLLLAVAAPLTIAERSLASSEIARREITAFYLAQEAIEFVRNARDTNVISGGQWLQGLDLCKSAGGCGVDPTSDIVNRQAVACNAANDDCTLWQNDSSLIFGYPTGHGSGAFTGWTEGEFKRSVSITDITPNAEVSVSATVSWGAGTPGARSLTVSSNLMNWYVAP